jgi:hypothetical protein
VLVGINHEYNLVANVPKTSKLSEKILVEAFPRINVRVAEMPNMLFPHCAKVIVQVRAPSADTARFHRAVR